MKRIILISLLLASTSFLHAQSPATGYRIGPELLDTLETQYLRMQLGFCRRNSPTGPSSEFHLMLDYGQLVSRTDWTTPEMRTHNFASNMSTNGLSGPDSKWVSVTDLVSALNVMYNLGWELVAVIPSDDAPSRGTQSGPGIYLARTSYLLKRR